MYNGMSGNKGRWSFRVKGGRNPFIHSTALNHSVCVPFYDTPGQGGDQFYQGQAGPKEGLPDSSPDLHMED